MRIFLGIVAALSMATGLAAQSAVSEPTVQWFLIPALFPAGARMALISGDPVTPGTLIALISMPDGYRMPPHYHTGDEHVEVMRGTFLVGIGDKLDVKKTMAMVAGDTGTAPAGAHHFAVAKGATIIRVTATAPYVVNYVNAKEEPWRPFPHGY